MPRLLGTSWMTPLKSPHVTFTFIVPLTTPGMVTFSHNYGQGIGGGRNRCALMNLKKAC
jgi:hypothetical protein